MHIEFLIEDVSGRIMLEHLVKKVLPSDWTCRITAYRGVGVIPVKGRYSDPDVIAARTLLDNLPRLLEGYGRAYGSDNDQVAVVIICDLDRKELSFFRNQLNSLLALAPHHLRHSYFCLAIEEGEAWLLGDKSAVESAYPRAKRAVLNKYKYDSICGTWELLADAVLSGGSKALLNGGYQAIGKAKCEWAERISPVLRIHANQSPSFQVFIATLQKLIQENENRKWSQKR